MDTTHQVVVRFRGGPLGGEEKVWDRRDFIGRRLLVPAIMPARLYYSETESPKAAFLPVVTEEYDLRQTGFAMYEALWIHPQEHLVRENARLKDRLREMEDMQLVLDAVKRLVK